MTVSASPSVMVLLLHIVLVWLVRYIHLTGLGCRKGPSREEYNKGKTKVLQEVVADNDSEGVVLVVNQHITPGKSINEGQVTLFLKVLVFTGVPVVLLCGNLCASVGLEHWRGLRSYKSSSRFSWIEGAPSHPVLVPFCGITVGCQMFQATMNHACRCGRKSERCFVHMSYN